MTRTTLNLDPTVLRELKRRGQRESRSLGEVASELLARALAEAEPGARDEAFVWTTAAMRARVDLEDRDAVQTALDHG